MRAHLRACLIWSLLSLGVAVLVAQAWTAGEQHKQRRLGRPTTVFDRYYYHGADGYVKFKREPEPEREE